MSKRYLKELMSTSVPVLDHSNQGTAQAYTWGGGGLGAGSAVINLSGYKITGGAASGLSGTDLATVDFVTSLIQGIKWKDPVEALEAGTLLDNASVTSVTSSSSSTIVAVLAVSGTFTVDAYDFNDGERVLIQGEAGGTGEGGEYNGIYDVGIVGTALTLTRSSDADTGADYPSAAIFVKQGSTYQDSGWTCTNDSPPTLGTTVIVFSQFSGAAGIPDATAGSGGGVKGKVTVDNAGGGLTTAGLTVASGVIALDLYTNDFEIQSGTTIGLKINEAAGLESSASGLGLNLEASNPSLQFTANEVGLKIDASGGLQKGAAGVGAKLDSTTNASSGLAVGSDGLSVLVEPAGVGEGGLGYAAGNAGLNINLGTDPGLELTADGLEAKVDGTTITKGASGLVVSASGLGVEVRETEKITIDATDITNKYAAVSLTHTPINKAAVEMKFVRSGEISPEQEQADDFNIVTDLTNDRRVSWDSAEATITTGMDGDLANGDTLIVQYTRLAT